MERMTGSYRTVMEVPTAEYTYPPLHAAHAIDIKQVCQFPLQMIVKKSDTTIHLSVHYVTLRQSSLGRFYVDHQAENNWRRWGHLTLGGQRVKVVGANGGVVSLFMELDGIFMNLRCREGAAWASFCVANDIEEGDKVALWWFTRQGGDDLWMAVFVTGKRIFQRSVGVVPL